MQYRIKNLHNAAIRSLKANYSGYDPEVKMSVLNPGKDDSSYPRSREFGLGLNVGF